MSTGRELEFVSLNDPHTYPRIDGGKTQDGADTTSRAQIRAMMKKYDRTTGLPIFRIAKTPDAFDTEFDRDVLMEGGRYALPSETWMKERAKRMDGPAKELKATQERLEREAANMVVKGLAHFVGTGGTGAIAPPLASSEIVSPAVPLFQDAYVVAAQAAYAQALSEGKPDDEAHEIARKAGTEARKEENKKRVGAGAPPAG